MMYAVIMPLIIYIIVIVFIVRYLLKILKVQTERNEILKEISSKLDKKDE